MAPQSRAHHLLLVVCGVFAVLSLVLVPLTLPLGWDETVYASRFSPYAPTTPFSAPRTRGVPFLIAPVATWSDSVVLLRVWLTLLATAALYLGFRPWLRFLGRPSGAAVAAALYGGLWFVLFYASAAMPNHYTAMGAVGAVGLFLRSRQSPVTCAGVAGGLALATLMRPNDGVALGVPLLATALLVPAWRGWSRVLAVLGGLAAGALPWIVEAYVRFGGVRERLTEASEVQGDLRPLLSVVHHLTVMDGPLLCRPCDSDTVRPLSAEWWFLLPLLVAVGLWSARSGSRGVGGPRREARQGPQGRPPQPSSAVLPGCLLAAAVALSAALPYLVLVPYAAPRFLAPTHALLAPAAALGVLALVDVARASRRPRIGLVALGLALAGHLAVQLPLAHSNAGIQAGARGDWARVAEVLHEHGVGGESRTSTSRDSRTGRDSHTGRDFRAGGGPEAEHTLPASSAATPRSFPSPTSPAAPPAAAAPHAAPPRSSCAKRNRRPGPAHGPATACPAPTHQGGSSTYARERPHHTSKRTLSGTPRPFCGLDVTTVPPAPSGNSELLRDSQPPTPASQPAYQAHEFV